MKMSLKIKSICAVLFVAVVLECFAVAISYSVYANTMDTHYENMTMKLTRTEAVMLDQEMMAKITKEVVDIYRTQCSEDGEAPDFESFSDEDWGNYYALFEPVMESEAFQIVMDQLQEMAEANEVASIYICYMDVLTNKAIYIIDGSLSEDICLPGTCDDIEAGNLELINQGVHDFPAYITNYEEYGWLCSAATGIMGDDGEVIAHAYVDISMDDVMEDRENFLVRLSLVLIGITIVLGAVMVYLINRVVVTPINSLAKATGTFVSDKEKHGIENENSAIARLEVHTGDEIENLADSIKKMEVEINTYIGNLTVVTAEKERIGAELNVATQIQSNMLPNIFPAFPEHEEFDIYASMAPAKEVGGDFYDLFMVDETHLAIVMADVSGKGVPAALFMVIAKTLIKNHVQNGENPALAFTNVNNQLCENNEVGMFVTGWLGVMDINTGHMDYVNAGHNYPIILRADGSIEWVKCRPGLVLAGMEGLRYRQYELQLNEGDTIYLYTDGVTEALDVSLELFGDTRLEQVMSSEDIRGVHPEELLQKISEELKVFTKGAEQADDITMLALYRSCNVNEKGEKWAKIQVNAEREEWTSVCGRMEEELETAGCSMKVQTQILVAAEEIFVNIASYAYEGECGLIEVMTRLDEERNYQIRFEDKGIPYNPLQKQDPDITLSAEERGIGGLGIYIVKKSMDDVTYEYREGKNCLTITKKI